MSLDPELTVVLAGMAKSGRKPLHEGTIQEAREAFSAAAARPRECVTPIPLIEDILLPGDAGEIGARVYRPRTVAVPMPTVVYFHGGGWVFGDLDTHDNIARDIARGSDSVVVSVDYRRAPEAPFPAAVDDAIAAARAVSASLKALGGNEVFAVAGDSAGGNLAAVCAQKLRDEGTHVAGQLLIYPATDPIGVYPSQSENAQGYGLDAITSAWCLAQYTAGKVDPKNPQLAPLHAADLRGLPPAVIATAEFDMLRDDGESYARLLREAGVRVHHTRYDGLIHAFFGFDRWSAAARAAVEEITTDFGSLLRSDPAPVDKHNSYARPSAGI